MKKLQIATENKDSVTNFMQGFDHILVLQLLDNLNWKPIVVTDVEYIEGTEIENHVIRHAGSIIPNGQIIDAENVYQNTEEFLEYVEANYPELEGFVTLKGNTALDILKENNQEYSIKNLNKTDKKYLEQYIQYVKETF